jgi:hypothetical protein
VEGTPQELPKRSRVVARVVETPAEVPLPLPPGVTVVPVQDPDGFARSLADHTGGTLVASAGDVASVIARRRMASVGTDPDGVATEVAWLQGLLEGAPAELPPRLVGPGERTALLKALAERLAAAREEAKAARIALLKREAAVQAEVRKTTQALEVEPELARRVAHRVNVTLRQARAAQRALGPKPMLDKETEQQARRAMSRLEDALFASAKARARVHSRLAVGNVIGLVLVLAAAVAVWSGSDIDAPSIYTVFALAGLSPLAALAIGGVGAAHARRRVHSAHAACVEAFGRAGVEDADQLAGRRRELEEWLDRADATAAARDAWNEAKAAWEAMAGTDADPKAVDEMLEEGARLRMARAEASVARNAVDEAMAAVAAAEDAVRQRLDDVLGGRSVHELAGGGNGEAPIVVAGSGADRIVIERMEPSLPVALVTGIDSAPEVPVAPEVRLYDDEAVIAGGGGGRDDFAVDFETGHGVGTEAEAETDERPTQAHSFVFDAESARRLRRRVRRRR